MVDLRVPVDDRQDLGKHRAGFSGFSRFNLRFSERRALLICLDLLAMNAALLVAMTVLPGHKLSLGSAVASPQWFLLMGVLWVVLAYPLGAYNLRICAHLSTTIPVVLRSAMGTTVIFVFIPFTAPALPDLRLSLLAFFFLALFWPLVGRMIYRAVMAQPLFHQRSLIVGCGWAGLTIAKVIIDHDDPSHRIVGFVDETVDKVGSTLTVQTENGRSPTFSILGDRYSLRDLIAQYRITTLVLASTKDVNGELLQELMDCLELGVEIIPMPILFERLTGLVPVEQVGGNWYVGVPIHHPGTGTLWPLTKRLIDILVGLFGLVVLALITPPLALAIRLDSRGPIFYTQTRVGKGGRLFKVIKFRSMVSDAERGRAQWARENDSRITRVGWILRRTHVDEFPQFVNILKGEMSVVGPRPERPEFVEELVQEIPFYRVRHAVKPGAAGWGLLNQGYGASKMDALVKLQYDLYYIKHQSLWLDVYIILKTIIYAITFNGR